jgi:predicted transcriptional regulator of viral defense system
MPRSAASGARPDWNRLYELAAGQGGYFTLADAAEAGLSPPLLQHHVKAHRVERTGRGILRLVNFPPTDEEDLVPIWLWSDRTGVFSHETALALHRLSDALPGKKHLTVPASWSKRRLQVPEGVVLHYADLSKNDMSWKGPVRITSPVRTIHDCIDDAVDPDHVRQAITQGIRRGLFSKNDVKSPVTKRSRKGTRRGAS